MSFPGRTSIAYKICSLLRDQAMTSSDICAGINEHSAKTVRVAILKAHEEGFIEVDESGKYSLTRIMRRHLDQCEKQVAVKPVGKIALPRCVNLFTPAMTGYKLNVMGTRPEAHEIMQARSRHL